jgi:hypothetical protein
MDSKMPGFVRAFFDRDALAKMHYTNKLQRRATIKDRQTYSCYFISRLGLSEE